VTASPVTGPYLAAVVLLGGAGVAKAARPYDTARALRVAGIRADRGLVRLGALAELTVAAVALAWPGTVTGGLVAACYLGFSGFLVVALRRRWPISSCGCFGRPDVPPTRLHLVLDLAAAAAATWWAADPGTLTGAFTEQPWLATALAIETLALIVLAWLAFTDPLGAARRQRLVADRGRAGPVRLDAEPGAP
jgi:hypothetical protein